MFRHFYARVFVLECNRQQGACVSNTEWSCRLDLLSGVYREADQRDYNYTGPAKTADTPNTRPDTVYTIETQRWASYSRHFNSTYGPPDFYQASQCLKITLFVVYSCLLKQTLVVKSLFHSGQIRLWMNICYYDENHWTVLFTEARLISFKHFNKYILKYVFIQTWCDSVWN